MQERTTHHPPESQNHTDARRSEHRPGNEQAGHNEKKTNQTSEQRKDSGPQADAPKEERGVKHDQQSQPATETGARHRRPRPGQDGCRPSTHETTQLEATGMNAQERRRNKVE